MLSDTGRPTQHVMPNPHTCHPKPSHMSSRAKPRDLRRSPTATALFTDAPAHPHRRTGEGRYPGDGRGYHHPNCHSRNPSYRTPMRNPRWGNCGWERLRLRVASTQWRTLTTPRYPLQRLTGITRYPGDGRGYHHPNCHSRNPSYRTTLRYPRWGNGGRGAFDLRPARRNGVPSPHPRTPTVLPA